MNLKIIPLFDKIGPKTFKKLGKNEKEYSYVPFLGKTVKI